MEQFKFKLRGCTWTVRLVTEAEFKVYEPENYDNMGLTVFESLICYVRTDIHPDQVKSTLWHEITHAILCPTNGSHVTKETDSVDLETACNLIGDALLEILPQIKKWPIRVLPKNLFYTKK